jgi:hypothetical protein
VEVSSLFPYLVILLVILFGRYVNFRKTKEQQQHSAQLRGLQMPQESQQARELSDIDAQPVLFFGGRSSTEEVTSQEVSTSQKVLLPREKPVHGSAYRSLAGTREAPANWTTQKGAIRKSAYRAQFKNQREIRRAVISMTVLGPCRSEEPYKHK